jgi:hypothetical protein
MVDAGYESSVHASTHEKKRPARMSGPGVNRQFEFTE